MLLARVLTLKKAEYVKDVGMTYVEIWEHDRQIVRFSVPIKSEECGFFCGRTNATKLYYTVKEGRGNLLLRLALGTDVPVGQQVCEPLFLTRDFQGIIQSSKIKILPPKQLYHPVLKSSEN